MREEGWFELFRWKRTNALGSDSSSGKLVKAFARDRCVIQALSGPQFTDNGPLVLYTSSGEPPPRASVAVCKLTCEPPRVFIELVINTAIWSHYNRFINVVVPCVFFPCRSAPIDIRVFRWSGALPSILGSRLFLRMREAILFPERYDSDIAAAASGNNGAQSTVRFAQASQRQTTRTSTGAGIGPWGARSNVQESLLNDPV